jgi:Fe-S cluster assembly ATP-binding protein
MIPTSINVNDGFSGGEKKRLEILQMAVLKPLVAILDETDSGLDIDALKVVSNGINAAALKEGGVLLVTHYQRILNYVKPDKIHVMMNGKIVLSGGPELALQLEEQGYDWIKNELPADIEV